MRRMEVRKNEYPRAEKDERRGRTFCSITSVIIGIPAFLSTKKRQRIIVKIHMPKKSRARFPVPAAVLALLAGILLRVLVFDILRVDGISMEPGIRDGSVLVVCRTAYGLPRPLVGGYIVRWGSPNPGDVVVYGDIRDGGVKIKRSAGSANGAVFVTGDNGPISLDSRIFGSIPVESVRGKVLFSIER